MRFDKKPGARFVSSGDFAMASHDDGALISESTWNQKLQPGMGIDMSIILRRSISGDGNQVCPACESHDPKGATQQGGITWCVYFR
jgi:hypothetical protein